MLPNRQLMERVGVLFLNITEACRQMEWTICFVDRYAHPISK